MKTAKTLLTLLFAGMIGCNKPADDKVSTRDSYVAAPQQAEAIVNPDINTLPKQASQLEGKIIKVQPSIVSYRHEAGVGTNSTISANHEFLYVMLETGDKKIHTFIFPYSKAILEREASLNYVPLPLRCIDSEKFVETFIGYKSDDHFVIQAEGFITPDGIKYK